MKTFIRGITQVDKIRSFTMVGVIQRGYFSGHSMQTYWSNICRTRLNQDVKKAQCTMWKKNKQARGPDKSVVRITRKLKPTAPNALATTKFRTKMFLFSASKALILIISIATSRFISTPRTQVVTIKGAMGSGTDLNAARIQNSEEGVGAVVLLSIATVLLWRTTLSPYIALNP
jgi:hypothetical protein